MPRHSNQFTRLIYYCGVKMSSQKSVVLVSQKLILAKLSSQWAPCHNFQDTREAPTLPPLSQSISWLRFAAYAERWLPPPSRQDDRHNRNERWRWRPMARN